MKGGRFTIHKARKQIILICFIIYLLAVFWYTVLNRQTGLQSAQFKLIWSYKEWVSGDWELGKEIMANMAMFIPFGFLLAEGLFKYRFIIPAATLFSVRIEMFQKTGYADGYSRLLSNRGWVLINGKKAPIVGNVCMDQMMVDVTRISGVQLGTEVVLIGKSGNEKITADDLAHLYGTIGYEIVCGINKRVERLYVD